MIRNLVEINTNESDINPVSYKNQIIFTSTRSYAVDISSTGFYDLFSANYSPSRKFLKVNPFNSYINTSFHEGPICISGDGSTLYFTRNIIGDSKTTKLGIFKCTMPVSMNQSIEPSLIEIKGFEYSMGHPSITRDGSILYFISNAPDGKGGLDIYKSRFEDGNWSKPENLGNAINTRGNEMFPFVYNDSILYFASDGHGGLGGLDIFKVNLDKKPLKVENLGYPINTNYDDFSLFFPKTGQIGYLSSNRPGGIGGDDIYEVETLNFKIKGSLVDAESKDLLEDAEISILMEDGEEFKITKSSKGEFEFSIIPGESYTLIIEKENYEAEKIFFDKNATMELRKQMMIELEPLQKSEIKLEPGQKYNFISGKDSVDKKYEKSLNKLTRNYPNATRNPGTTILNKQFRFEEGEIYSMQLIKDPNRDSTLSVENTIVVYNNDTSVLVKDSSFFTLPADEETHFKVQTDLEHFDENFTKGEHNLNVDSEPVFDKSSEEEEAIKQIQWLLSLNINTDEKIPADDVDGVTSEGFSIIPGTSYILMVGKKGPVGHVDKEIRIPLTGGVKYDFNPDPSASNNYKDKLNDLLDQRKNIEVNPYKAIDISLLSKELKIEKGEEFSFNLFIDSNNIEAVNENEDVITKVYLKDETIELSKKEKLTINVPYTAEKTVNIQTDINYLQDNFNTNSYNLDLDTIPFFSEIIVDTTGYHKRFFDDELALKKAEQEEAINEIKWLMSLHINTEDTSQTADNISNITTSGFSVIPGSDYLLKVGKKSPFQTETKELNIPLTGGVKYNFSSDPSMGDIYIKQLNVLMNDRKNININKDKAIDISMLSKELKIEEGEEILFNLIPDSLSSTFHSQDKSPTTIITNNETIELNSDEKLNINVPYTDEKIVNLQTDISFLEQNFKPENLNLEMDTFAFFSEIIVDTTGYYRVRQIEEYEEKRKKEKEDALDELEWLLSLQINSTEDEKGSSIQKVKLPPISSDGFSIIPNTDYILKVGRKTETGQENMEFDIPLTTGVKYDFTTNPEAIIGYRDELDDLILKRKGLEVNENTAIDISLLSKELNVKKGEEISFNIFADSSIVLTYDQATETGAIILVDEYSIDVKKNEEITINVPYSEDKIVNLKTDLQYLKENFEETSYNIAVDTFEFFSEIIVDTTGLHKRKAIANKQADEEDAIKELQWLMSLNINPSRNEDSTVPGKKLLPISSEGFSIIPKRAYILKVGKTGDNGVENIEIDISLASGVKYNFTSNIEAVNENKDAMGSLLTERKDVEVNDKTAIDISFLSKELNIKEGEEISFNLIPDSSVISEDMREDETSAMILLDNENIEVKNDEELTINIPYTSEKKVNILTDIQYLKENFEATSYKTEIDTFKFFSEINMDTTGLHKRYASDEKKLKNLKEISEQDITVNNNIVYRVQIAASRKEMSDQELYRIYKGKNEVRMFQEDGWYKYYIAEKNTYFEALEIKNSSNVEGAFIAAYDQNHKLALKQAMMNQYKEQMKRNGQNTKDTIVNMVTVNFAFNKFSISSGDQAYLQKEIIGPLQGNNDYYVIINGHSDVRGSMAYNYALGEERADYIKNLITGKGIDEDRIITYSFGETQLLKSCETPVNCDESVHQVNRRVEIILFAPSND